MLPSRKHLSRAVSLILAIGCLALAIAVRRPPARPDNEPAADFLLAQRAKQDEPKEDEEILSRPVPAFDATGIRLETLVQEISVTTGVDFRLRYGIPGDTAFDVHFKDARVADVANAIVQGLVSGGCKDAGFEVVDGSISIYIRASFNDGRPKEIGCFNIRPLIEKLGEKTRWRFTDARPAAEHTMTAPFTGSHEYGGGSVAYQAQMAVAQVVQTLFAAVDPDSWKSAHATEVGGVLVVRQTPNNLAETRRFLDAFGGAIGSPTPVTFTMHRNPTTRPVAEESLTFVNIGPLLESLEDAPDDSDEIVRITEELKWAVDFIAGPIQPRGTDQEIAQTCGNILVLGPAANQKTAMSFLTSLTSKAHTEGFSPTMLGPTLKQLSEGSGKIQALFNVRSLANQLTNGSATTYRNDPIQAYILRHRNDVEWEAVGGGKMYSLGAVLMVTQTPRNIEQVQRVLDKWAAEIQSQKNSEKK